MSTKDERRCAPTLRILFQLDRGDMPRLYDELVRFNKGVKRAARLRTLANEGLLRQSQNWVDVAARRGDPSSPLAGAGAAVLNDLFGPAIDET